MEACINWSKSKDRDGYGYISVCGKIMKAHRVAYERAYGDIPVGGHILHSCDNPSCINPRHLSLGTNASNVADKVAKGRQLKGEGHPAAKLTEECVRQVKCLLALGVTGVWAASAFGVTPSTVCAIKKGRNW